MVILHPLSPHLARRELLKTLFHKCCLLEWEYVPSYGAVSPNFQLLTKGAHLNSELSLYQKYLIKGPKKRE